MSKAIKMQGLKDAVIEAAQMNQAEGVPYKNLTEAVIDNLNAWVESPASYGLQSVEQLVEELEDMYPFIQNYF